MPIVRWPVTVQIRENLYTQRLSVMYEGRSINKLQNSVILLVFKIWKIQNIRFVGNFILSSSCEFYDDDITVMLFINIKYCDVAIDICP